MQSLYLNIKNKIKTLFPAAKFYADNEEYILVNPSVKTHDELRNKIMLNNYYSVYFGDSCRNLSFYIEIDAHFVFYITIFLEKIDASTYKVHSSGELLDFPLIANPIPNAIKKSLLKNYYDLIKLLVSNTCIRPLVIELPSDVDPKSIQNINEYFRHDKIEYLLEHRIQSGQNYTITNRKSYKNLIQRGNAKFEFRVLKNCVWNEFQSLMYLHEKIAGRMTRSESTWRIMHNWLQSGSAFAIVGYLEKRLVGYALFTEIDDGFSYASAAYERGNDFVGLSHASVATAIITVSKFGGSSVYFGRYDPLESDQKISSIAHFKLGFVNNVQPKVLLRSIN